MEEDNNVLDNDGEIDYTTYNPEVTPYHLVRK